MIEKALICRCFDGNAYIICTNSFNIHDDMEYVGNYGEDLFGKRAIPEELGFYLWEGKSMVYENNGEYDMKFEGMVRKVEYSELPELMKLELPNDEPTAI